jgi:CBS domain-containing protein
MAKPSSTKRAIPSSPTSTPRILRARDLMEKDIISITPDTRISDVQRLFVEDEIHGAPVLDEDGRVRGVISTQDVLRIAQELPDRMDELTAADAMTKEVVAVGPDASAADVANAMTQHRVHRVLVCENGILLGLVTTFDLLRALKAPNGRIPVSGSTRRTGYSR